MADCGLRDADGRMDLPAVRIGLPIGGIGHDAVAAVVLKLLGDSELGGLDDIVASVDDEAGILDTTECEDGSARVLDHAVAVVPDGGRGSGEPVAGIDPFGNVGHGCLRIRDLTVVSSNGLDVIEWNFFLRRCG